MQGFHSWISHKNLKLPVREHFLQYETDNILSEIDNVLSEIDSTDSFPSETDSYSH